MHPTRDDLQRSASDWQEKAEREDWRCQVCSTRICYGDRHVFFQTRMCGDCADQGGHEM